MWRQSWIVWRTVSLYELMFRKKNEIQFDHKNQKTEKKT